MDKIKAAAFAFVVVVGAVLSYIANEARKDANHASHQATAVSSDQAALAKRTADRAAAQAKTNRGLILQQQVLLCGVGAVLAQVPDAAQSPEFDVVRSMLRRIDCKVVIAQAKKAAAKGAPASGTGSGSNGGSGGTHESPGTGGSGGNGNGSPGGNGGSGGNGSPGGSGNGGNGGGGTTSPPPPPPPPPDPVGDLLKGVVNGVGGVLDQVCRTNLLGITICTRP